MVARKGTSKRDTFIILRCVCSISISFSNRFLFIRNWKSRLVFFFLLRFESGAHRQACSTSTSDNFCGWCIDIPHAFSFFLGAYTYIMFLQFFYVEKKDKFLHSSKYRNRQKFAILMQMILL